MHTNNKGCTDCDAPVWTDKVSESPEQLQVFADAYIGAFSYLSTYHIALGDQLIHPLASDVLDRVLGDNAARVKEDIISSVFGGEFKHSNFSGNGLRALFEDDSIISDPGFVFVVRHLVCEYEKLCHRLHIIKTGLPVLVKESLERSDREPIVRYVELLQKGFFVRNSYLESHDIQLALMNWDSKMQSPHFGLNRVIFDEKADPYDLTHGYRLLSFYDSRDLLSTVYSEYEHMYMNNMELVKCKNCGRFFRPISRASNFCDRPLEDGSGRTCKSISSQWYVDQRKGENPAYDEYVLYRKRYRSRITRNSTKNPYSRYDDWNIQAHTLLESYNRGEITLEAFSKKLKEMDKDMKPLDKM